MQCANCSIHAFNDETCHALLKAVAFILVLFVFSGLVRDFQEALVIQRDLPAVPVPLGGIFSPEPHVDDVLGDGHKERPEPPLFLVCE